MGKLPHTLEYPQEDEKSPMFHNRDKNDIVAKKKIALMQKLKKKKKMDSVAFNL